MSITIEKSSGTGVLIDTSAPTYCWKDLIGHIIPRLSGGPAPTLNAFNGTNVLSYAFAAGDVIDQITMHIPHDYVPGTDIYLHLHWGHNGTAISGNFVVNWYHLYAKGHQQAVFTAEKNITQTIATSIGTYPRYQHNITEFQLSTPGGSATLMDTSVLEPDGILIISLIATTIPTITGGTPNQPFIFFADVHYQSTNVGTKQKAPNFYV